MPIASILTAALVLLKLLGYIDVSWWLVLAPILLVWLVFLLFIIFGASFYLWVKK